MKWFARGRLWDTPEQAQWAGKNLNATTEKRGKEWRPGGQHKDPRARFDRQKDAPKKDHRQQRSDKPSGAAQLPGPAREKPAGAVPPVRSASSTTFRPVNDRKLFRPADGKKSFPPAHDKKSFRPADGRKSFGPARDNASFRQADGKKSFPPSHDRKSFRPADSKRSFRPARDNASFRQGDDSKSFRPADKKPDRPWNDKKPDRPWKHDRPWRDKPGGSQGQRPWQHAGPGPRAGNNPLTGRRRAGDNRDTQGGHPGRANPVPHAAPGGRPGHSSPVPPGHANAVPDATHGRGPGRANAVPDASAQGGRPGHAAQTVPDAGTGGRPRGDRPVSRRPPWSGKRAASDAAKGSADEAQGRHPVRDNTAPGRPPKAREAPASGAGNVHPPDAPVAQHQPSAGERQIEVKPEASGRGGPQTEDN
jgi:hypothetical protein